MELLIVMIVLGLLLAFAAPGLLTLRSTSLSAAGSEFGSFLNLCRTKAIAERDSIRVGIVVRSSVNPDNAYRQYAGWEWDKKTYNYVRFSKWMFLPSDSAFENKDYEYIKKSDYAQSEKSAVEGDFLLDGKFQNEFTEVTNEGETLAIRYLTFSPSGRAYVDEGEKRNLILVMRDSFQAGQEDVKNWYQFTVDTLTGRTRIYRP